MIIKYVGVVAESPIDDNSSASLLCVQCKDAFQNAWDLMVHAQAAHTLNIYELGVPRLANCTSPSLSPRDTPDKVMCYSYKDVLMLSLSDECLTMLVEF